MRSRRSPGQAGSPDGKRLLVAGFEEGKGQRVYVQDLAGGVPRPVTPEGVAVRANTLRRMANGSRHACSSSFCSFRWTEASRSR